MKLREWKLEDYLNGYVIGVYPEWNDAVLEQETISRSIYDRDWLHEHWDELTEEQKQLVIGADIEIIKHVKEVNEWCVYDGRWRERKKRRPRPTLERWWWYLDRIATRLYPVELLPPHLREVVDYARKG